MSDNLTVERVDLQKKDKSELQTIVTALGGKPASRATKANLIDAILELSGAVSRSTEPDRAEAGSSPADSETGAESSETTGNDSPAKQDAKPEGATATDQPRGAATEGEQSSSRRRRRGGGGGEPPAEWEKEVSGGDAPSSGGGREQNRSDQQRGSGRSDKSPKSAGAAKGAPDKSAADKNTADKSPAEKSEADKNTADQASAEQRGDEGNGANGSQNNQNNNQNADDPDSGNRRRRRRGRGRDRDDEQLAPLDSLVATGYLDLREDGYGFLRVNGYLQSAEDVYVPVKMARLHGLRKGDLVEGTARPANRNEKNPALQSVTRVNGNDPEQSKGRVRFEDLTPVYPFERLLLETTERPTASAARLVDLLAPIGKGQRGLIVAPPESGSLELIKQIAGGIETNNPETHLMVLLFDGRPEDVVEIERSLEFGEVAAASFDAPPEEQCALVDFTTERAKRMVEAGEDVVVIADGLTSIARAYSLGTQPTGRTISGVDAAALHPTKRFFGSARKLEEAGSLTILATITVGTGALFDEAIFEEFQGTATSEIHLDAWLADEGVFPNIDVELSQTRSADLLVEPDDLGAVDSLRRLMAAAIDEADGPAVDAARRLVERLESTPTNADFLKEISSASTL